MEFTFLLCKNFYDMEILSCRQKRTRSQLNHTQTHTQCERENLRFSAASAAAIALFVTIETIIIMDQHWNCFWSNAYAHTLKMA